MELSILQERIESHNERSKGHIDDILKKHLSIEQWERFTQGREDSTGGDDAQPPTKAEFEVMQEEAERSEKEWEQNWQARKIERERRQERYLSMFEEEKK